MSPTPRGPHARLRLRAVVVPALLLLATVGTVGTATAYWTRGGTGSGAASASTAPTPVTLGAATPTAQLYPGGAAGVVLQATNPNAATLRIGSLVLDTTQGSGGLAVDAAHSGCALTALAFTPQTNDGSGWTLPASGSLSINLPASLTMTASAANACQGALFTVYLKAGS
jgi:hypothetical protein